MNRANESARSVALDSTRGFAIVAMIVAHTIPFTYAVAPRPVLAVEAALNDLASPLFALVIGATIAITAPTDDTRSGRWRYRSQLAIKAICLIVLGLLLRSVEANAHVVMVLDFLGATLLVALPLLFLRSRVLLPVIASLCLVGPQLTAWASDLATRMPHLVFPPTPATIVLEWLALGQSYRVLGLLPLLLLGLVLVRWTSGDQRRALPVGVAGLVVFALSVPWREAAVAGGTYTSGSAPDLLRDLGLSVLAFGMFSLIADAPIGGTRVVMRALLRPVSAQGEMALSIYVLHVLALAAIWTSALGDPASGWVGTARGWLVPAGLLIGCSAFALAWSRVAGPGPLERVIGVVSGRHPVRRLWRVRPQPSGAEAGGV